MSATSIAALAVLLLAAGVGAGVLVRRARKRKRAILREVSLGYTSELIGVGEAEVDGQCFDFEQRSIRADHVWVKVDDTPQGRAVQELSS